ncbi:MAG: tetratricopeptide repeat protein [Bryobacteraceae bacterium]
MTYRWRTPPVRWASRWLLAVAVSLFSGLLVQHVAAKRVPPGAAAGAPEPARITVDLPATGTIYPPDMVAPTFLWRDESERVAVWRVEISFGRGAAPLRLNVKGERLRVGEIDPQCVSPQNELPKLTPEEAAAHSWKPDPETWAAIKRQSVRGPATLTISGLADENSTQPVSQGQSTFQTSKDPVGAPIFYRDVPLIPSVGEKGVISPLPKGAIGYIKWRLRNIGETSSKTMMQGLPTCANCHSFSRDGQTLGLDVDGPQNDKGLYALVPLAKETAIRNENVIKWSAYLPFQKSVNIRVSFMSQVSPNGRYVVNMINDPGARQTGPGMRPQERIYVANFKDFRFGQVFYPTRGVLAWYDRETREFHPLPGASDPRYVQCGAFWSPDGKYLVFSRAEAKEPFPEGSKLALFANDPNETQIQYDLYRIPFNEGRGGVAEPIAGASRNGFSNSFPKVSPDGRWIVFVQARNGLLMRPDSRLFIVPFKGGKARLMNCNTRLMNSWHSFSPNGRWMVFSSKARSPYTQMYLTHIDRNGNDSPPVLIEDATAANRAVNIPEFVNIPADGLERIDHPATDYYRVFDRAIELVDKERYAEAVPEWRKAIELNGEEARPHFQLGVALGELGQVDAAIAEYREAIRIEPRSAPSYSNLAIALQGQGKLAEAIEDYRKSLELDSTNGKVRTNMAVALLEDGRTDEGIEQCKAALAENPQNGDAQNALGIVLARKGALDEAITHLEAAVAVAPGSVDYRFNLGRVLAAAGRFGDAIPHLKAAADLTGWREPSILDLLAAAYGEVRQFREAADVARRALAEAQRQNNRDLIQELTDMLAHFESEAAK